MVDGFQPKVRFRLSSQGSVRDASEVAFGILILGILNAVGALFLMLGTLSLAWSKNPPGIAFVTIAAVYWGLLMIPVFRHYRRATREWTGERRGGPILFVVECITSAVSIALAFDLPNIDAAAVRDARACMAAFLFLLVCSHVVTYVLLRYRPLVREWLVWGALAGALILEIRRNT